MSQEACKISKRLSPTLLDETQQRAITAMYERNTLVVAKMGAGKTVIAASAIAELLNDKVLKRVLVVTTPKIANTVWAQEFDKWQHTHHVSVIAATGDAEQRLAAIRSTAQVVVITFNVLPWAKSEKIFSQFDGLLIDETTKLKTTGGAQFKALRPALKDFLWRCGLTGTPVSEDFESLFAQIMLIDNGQSLGRNKQSFLTAHFFPTDFKQYNWQLKPGHDKQIMQKIKHVLHVVPDYRAGLPPIYYKEIAIQPPPDLQAYYNQMRNDMVTADAVSQTAAVLTGKLQQIASGFIYDEHGQGVRLSDYRVKALKGLLSRIGDNALIAYWYIEDLALLRHNLPDAEVFDNKTLQEQVTRWNAGQIKQLLIHPRSAGHGLQLEKGGATIIWFTPYWSRDLWEQLNARLWRKGQAKPVTVYSLIAVGTIDELVAQRVEDKGEFDKLFLQHVKGAPANGK